MEHLKLVPAMKFSLALICGILLGSNLFIAPCCIVPVLLTFSLILFICIRGNRCVSTAAILLAFTFGIFKSNIDFFYFEEKSLRNYPESKSDLQVKLQGIITEIPDYDTSGFKLKIESEIIFTNNDTVTSSGTILALIREDKYLKKKHPLPHLNPGDRIIMTGNISSPPGRRNPGEFDYRRYLDIQGIHKVLHVNGYDKIQKLSENNLNFLLQKIIFPAKIFSLDKIDEFSRGDEAALLKGLVTGSRGDISKEMKESFVNAGVMHLIAVSGLNVAYIIISLTLILSLFRIPLLFRTFVIIFFLILYCIFTGSSPSIVRAGTMGILVLVSVLIERKINFYNIIGISSLMILIWDTRQLYDPGFILSFAATLSMAILIGKCETIFPKLISRLRSENRKFILRVSALILTSIAAQVGTIPLTAVYFEKLSVISIATNVVAVPLANLSLAIGFFQILTAIFSDYLCSVVSTANNLLLQIQLAIISWSAGLDFAYININTFSTVDVFCFYAILIVLLVVNRTNQLIPRMVMCFLIYFFAILFKADFPKKLRIAFLDVGQGDCSVVTTPEDKTIIIDCGIITDRFNSGERTLGPYLRRNGIDKIDLLVITHLHSDHIGGINYLLEHFEISLIIESGQKIQSDFTKKMDSLITAKKIRRSVAKYGDLITVSDKLKFYFLFPTEKFVLENGYTIDNNLNNGSVVMMMKYMNTEVLFTGDVETEGEQFIYRQYYDLLKADILKAAHHGSKSSSSIPFLICADPDAAIISCGAKNKFNHPSDQTLKRLRSSGAEIYRTDVSGAVIFESDGNNIEHIIWK